MEKPNKISNGKPRVGLFVTCMLNAMRPSVVFSSIQLLKQSGCAVEVPLTQTCCGQPGFNNGDYNNTVHLAKKMIKVFEPFDYIVVPSGSCAGMIRHNYAHYVFAKDSYWKSRALKVAVKTYELTSFLVDIINYFPEEPLRDFSHLHVTYHDSCSCLRQMKVKAQPRILLKRLCNIIIHEMKDSDVCCGFGGSFSIKMPHISTSLADNKIDKALATGANILLGADMGCLLHLEGRAAKMAKPLQVFHIAEMLTRQGTENNIKGENSE